MLAVLAGLPATPEEARDLMQRVEPDKTLDKCSVYFRYYLDRAMVRAGLGEVRLYGVDLGSGRPGIVYDTLGLNGARAYVEQREKLQGIEFEGQMRVTDHWDVQAGLEWTKNEYTDFTFNFVAPLIATPSLRH